MYCSGKKDGEKTMAITPHTSFRLPEATRQKLAELAELYQTSQAQVINNLILIEYGARKNEIEEMKRKKQTEQTKKNT